MFVAGWAIGQQHSDRVVFVSMLLPSTHCLPWRRTAGRMGCSSGSSSSSNRCTSSLQVPGGVGVGSSSGHEDLPGVPAEAWVRVSRGLTPSEPYTQGESDTVSAAATTPLQPCRHLCVCFWWQDCTVWFSACTGPNCS